jgi:hypothetical protein
MHAVFVTANVRDLELTREEMRERVVPTVSNEPGFVAGYWIAPGDQVGKGNAVMLFESEDAARAAANRYEPLAHLLDRRLLLPVPCRRSGAGRRAPDPERASRVGARGLGARAPPSGSRCACGAAAHRSAR